MKINNTNFKLSYEAPYKEKALKYKKELQQQAKSSGKSLDAFVRSIMDKAHIPESEVSHVYTDLRSMVNPDNVDYSDDTHVLLPYELNMLGVGNGTNSYLNDKGEALNWVKEIAAQKLNNRQLVDNQLKQLLNENNILVPNDLNLTFTIDSNYKLTVSGTDNADLKNQLEILLNDTGTSENLFNHILNTYMKTNDKFTNLEALKYTTNKNLKNMTGYSLKDITVKDGNVFTNDGKSLFSILSSSKNPNSYIASLENGKVAFLAQSIKKLATTGFNNIKDLNLDINYCNGNLSDIGLKYGFGPNQLDWYTDSSKMQNVINEFLQL